MFKIYSFKKHAIRSLYIVFILMAVVLLFSTHARAQEDHTIKNQKTVDHLVMAMKYPHVLKMEDDATFNLAYEDEATLEQNSPSAAFEPKSKGKAFLLSFILPGAGEYYIGNKTLAKTFFITEVALWAGYFAFDTYSDWLRDDMYTMAATHANADIRNRPSQYYVDIGNFENIYDYNDAKQRQREYYKIYPVDEYFWQWDNDYYRKEFEDLRISSDRAHNRATFVVGGIIANHVISAIDAVWQSYRYNKNVRNKYSARKLKLQFSSIPDREIKMTLQQSF